MVGIPSSQERRSAVRLARRLVRTCGLLWLVLAVAACGEEPEEKSAASAPPAPPAAIYQLGRLDPTDRTLPEQWLASRQAGRDLAEDDLAVIELKRTLEVAGRRFREYPRMIANRAVQLEVMLKQKDMGEPAPQLIERLARVPGETRYVESFGALCQQYFNLRMQGHAPEEAVKMLKDGADASN
jgi:hypothetical protein